MTSTPHHRHHLLLLVLLTLVAACARMGNPDGGWYDEKPPRVVSTSPADGATRVGQKKVTILFDEFVTIDNPTENVIISPPQLEQAEIKTHGRGIQVVLKDSLRENTTYTIDFSNAIKDNNEGNLMGSYTFTFSTGDAIDTMQVAGVVVDAETLEPVQGIQVGLYAVGDSTESDSVRVCRFMSEPMLRIARTDQDGHFSVKGVKAGHYRVYALADQDGNFFLTPRSGEQAAFSDDIIVPSVYDDIRQDTTWLDSLHIKGIQRVPYKHFTPDNIMLRAFKPLQTDRALIKGERKEAEQLLLVFSYGDSIMPEVRGLNFPFSAADYIVESSEKGDSLLFWLRDTATVNTDSLELAITYRATDTLGILQSQTDTLMLLPKVLYDKRQKLAEKSREEWEKKQARLKKRGQPYDSIMPAEKLKMTISRSSQLDPDKNITLSFDTPLAEIDSTKIHLYIQRDSVWYNARWALRQKEHCNARTMELLAEWQPEMEYSFELDSCAFRDIYGHVSGKEKMGIRVKSLDEYGSLHVSMPSMEGRNIIARLTDQNGKTEKEVTTSDGTAHFYYLAEKDYYLYIIVDDNGNGRWDTGLFDSLTQPEEVYYFPKEIACRAKWDIKETWNPRGKALNEQKPSKLRKTKSSQRSRQQTGRNIRRAQELGIELPEYLR